METTQSPRVRPEVILGIVAALAAILVAVMAVMCPQAKSTKAWQRPPEARERLA